MSDQSPFDRPPADSPMNSPMPPPASGDWGPTTPFNPIGPRQSGPGRGKIVAVALGAAALTAGAIFGISKFADADDDTTLEAATVTAPEATAPPVSAGTENVGDDAPEGSIPDVFASIGECLDLEEIIGSLGAGEMGGATVGSLPTMDFSTVGDTVTITNADGVTVYTMGEGDASIAISKSAGEMTVAASGDITESTIVDFADFESQMDDMMGELENMDFEDMPMVSLPADFDPAEIQACIENLNLGGADG